MDGNGRWAKRRGQNRIFGHRQGIEATKAMVKAARRIGIKHLTLYALSTENLKRPKPELQALFSLLRNYLQTEVDEMVKNGVRLHVIGDLTRLPADIQTLIADAIERSKPCKKMNLNIALSYGGRDEILRAFERARAAKAGPLTEKKFSAFLDTGDAPDPDLLIRTGGDIRISNFLLWQLAYTELYFTRTLWPDFGPAHLRRAIRFYQRRERRFGLTSEQVREGDGF